MKAIQISQYGDASVLTVATSAGRPSAAEGQVLVEVYAASVNPADTMMRLGYMQKYAPLAFPATMGTDMAGVVVELGPKTAGFSTGDRVYGMASVAAGASGAFAEYAAVPAVMIARFPSRLGFPEAAALPLTAVSAVEVIEEKLKVQKGQKILIHGGAGGIGTIAIQLAKHHGAFVASTGLGEAARYLKELGADTIIDFEKEAFESLLDGYDFVFDTVAGITYRKSFAVLKKGGTIISMLEQPNNELAAQYGVTALAQSTGITTARLERVGELVTKGVIKVHVEKTYAVEAVKDAFLARESGKVRGKVVLTFK
jgi:NADPH:quinone reductase-like Zn-dependent oxidoreductase